MAMNRFLKYIVSERGRATSFNAICVSSITLFTINYAPHTLGVSKLREFLQLYRFVFASHMQLCAITTHHISFICFHRSNGFERRVPDKIQRRFEQALLACNCTDFERRHLKPFMAYGFDTLHIGSTKSRFGAAIGVPANYAYDNASHIEKDKIQLKCESIKWSTLDGQKLADALVLTEDEQIFGMARSVLQVKSHKLLLSSLYGPGVLFSIYALGSTINRRGNLYVRPVRLRLMLYGILSLFGYGVYSFLTDYTEVCFDADIDKQLGDVGPEFVEAGVRFYRKLLQKNVAIRNLSEDHSYTVSGNENFGLRQRSMPLTLRKSYFELRQNELNGGATAAAGGERM